LKALAFSNDSVIFTIGSLGELLIYALLIHLLLSFPSGRLDSRLDRVLVAIAYFNTVVIQAATFILSDPQQGCANCPANPLLLDHADSAAGVISAAQLDIAIAVLGAVVAILYRRWRDSSQSQRRSFAPVLAVGGLTFVLLMASLIVEQAGLSSTVDDGLTLALFGTLACLPFAFLTGLLRFRFSQAEAVSSLAGSVEDRCAMPSRRLSETQRWRSLIGFQTVTAMSIPRAGRCKSTRRRTERPRQSSSTKVAGSAPSSTMPTLQRSANSCRRWGSQQRSHSRMNGWTPSYVRTLTSFAPLARGSSPRDTRSASGWNGTFTTEHSNG
jgi:uncharacterized membrane protein YhaH (DUF805 family)